MDALFSNKKSHFSVHVHIDEEGKKAIINQKIARDSKSLREKIALVSFIPEDLSAIMGGASLRRRILDQITASLYPSYALYYRQYERILKQRNRLLKDMLFDLVELDSFTQILAQVAYSLEKTRILALEHISPIYEAQVALLSDGKLISALGYQPSSGGDLLGNLEKRKQEERIRKTTLLGPHLDDLDISLNNHPARNTASRGQSRILILALKIAQLKAIVENRRMSPILLLDDVIGELDLQHAKRLLNTVEQSQTQTFVTTTHLEPLFEQNNNNAIYYLSEGKLR